MTHCQCYDLIAATRAVDGRENLRLKNHFQTRDGTTDPSQRSAATIAHAHKRTLKHSSCHKQGETSCSSFARRLRSLHGLAGFAETINPSVNATDGLERSTMRQQRGRGGRGWGPGNTFFFRLFSLFFRRKNYCSGKIDFPCHISPGTQTIQRPSGDEAADSSCNIYQVLRKLETHDRRTAHR